MDIYARTPWSTVWTLNIDDTFEQAYDRVKSDSSRNIFTINWDDDFRHTNDLFVVHLHGCVDRTAPRRLIFSLSEYASSAVAQAAWPLNFRDIYGVSPFVVVGARLRDEPDIEAAVARRKPVSEAPSFYVSPKISRAMERDLRAWSLIPVEMTAEEFSLLWPELTGMHLDEPPSRREEISFRLGRQFREMPKKVSKSRKGHDFIGGDEPDWSDIQADLYAELDWIRQLAADCRQIGQSIRYNSAIIYVGERLTGRTTGLLAIGKELREQSWRPYQYVGDERLDVEAMLQFAASGQGIAFLFDSISDIADDVLELLQQARTAGLKIVCIAVDWLSQSAKIVERFNEAYLARQKIFDINSRLTRTDAARLVDKLESIGRLGILEEQSDARRIAHFRNREIFVSMEQLENAPGFGRRVGELVEALEERSHVEILFLAALASRFERRLSAADAARMVGFESESLVRLIRENSHVRSVLKTDGKWIKARHRYIGLEHCVSKLGARESLEFLSVSMNRLKSRLSREGQRARNSASLFVGSLMAYKNVVGIFPQADLESWYRSLHSTFGEWSARYWEQRAIMNRHLGKSDPNALSRAESFALRAVTLTRDSYSLTTLGTVLITKAAYGRNVDIGSYYDRAIDAFQEASSENPTNIVAWLAYLRAALDVIEKRKGEAVDSELTERIGEDWMRIHSQVLSVSKVSESTKKELEGLWRRFASLQARI
ncbi:SIR2 family protein [Streptomyces cynarae]|uniref:SIR2 family protein n=1 Tax=Streptomyces cynarae TaxID=2981134 RepID=UPI00406CB23A